MSEINRGDSQSSDKVKNRRGLTYAAILVVLFIGILALQNACDSSAYTFNGEKINRIGLTIFFSLVAVGVAIGLIFFRNKKK